MRNSHELIFAEGLGAPVRQQVVETRGTVDTKLCSLETLLVEPA